MRSQNGFTLLEVLVAVAIMALILGVFYSTFFLTHRAIENVCSSGEKILQVRRLLDMLRQEIESASINSIKVQDRDIYGKDGFGLQFTGFLFNRPSSTSIAYFVVERDGKLDLCKTIKLANGRQDMVVMLEDIEGFRVKMDDDLVNLAIKVRFGPKDILLSRIVRPMKDARL